MRAPLPACRSCGSDGVCRVGPIPPGALFAGRELTEPLDPGQLYRCETCRLWFRHPVPDSSVLASLYRTGDPGAWQYPVADRQDWQLAHQWLQEHLQAGAVLDLGCFDGAFLSMFDATWTRFGVEMNPLAARKARAKGITILGDDVGCLVEEGSRFDAVVAFDLLEHMPDPRVLLRMMVGVTKPGGVVIIGTGNTAAPSWRFMGSRYWYCAIPEHLSFINPAWCRLAATELQLALVQIERYSHADRRPLMRRGLAVVKNVLYRITPFLFESLRRRGFGSLDVRRHPAWASVPPEWLTARDHLLAVFRAV